MARTIEEIYNAMITEKQTFSSLNGLTPNANYQSLMTDLSTKSKVAIWRLMIYIVAVGIWIHEQYWLYAKQELEAIAAESIAGNLQWYQKEIKKWQYGFLLLWNGVSYKYYYADTTSTAALDSRLADKVACVEVFNQDFRGIIVKVAKVTSSGIAALTQLEIDSLNSYIDRIKFAGVQTDVISQPADKILLNLKIYYQGTLSAAQMLIDVKAAINRYIENIEFDGVFYLIKMIDEIQAVDGVQDISLLSAQGKVYTGSYASFSKEYVAESGWFEFDTASTITLQKV